MTTRKVAKLLRIAAANYEDYYSKHADEILIRAGRCYGISVDSQEESLGQREDYPPWVEWPYDGLQADLAVMAVFSSSELRAYKKIHFTSKAFREMSSQSLEYAKRHAESVASALGDDVEEYWRPSPSDTYEAALGDDVEEYWRGDLNLVSGTARRMWAERARLRKRGSVWATMTVNTYYLVGALCAPKPEYPRITRAIPFTLDQVDDLYARNARELAIDCSNSTSWRWKATRLAWQTGVQLIREFGSPYFTPEEADDTWERAIAAAIAETCSGRPKGGRRAEPTLWRLFHPPQPDSEPERLEECRIHTGYPRPRLATLGIAVEADRDGGAASLRSSHGAKQDSLEGMVGEEYLTVVDRGAFTIDGKGTAYFALFVVAIREAAETGDTYAQRVVRQVDSRQWWTESASLGTQRREE